MPFTITIQHTFTDEDVRNLIISAFEGGSNYWGYTIARHDYGGYGPEDFQGVGAYANPEYTGSLHLYLLPFESGTALILVDGGEDSADPTREYRLDRQAIQTGLELMRDRYPHHWDSLVGDNADAETGDVFLQLCMFGEVIYG